MTTFISLCISSVILLLCIHSGFSIICWVCRSDTDPKCSDPFDNSTIPIYDCSQDRRHYPYTKATKCRKTQEITPNGLLTVRSCDWMTNGSCSDVKNNSDYEYCSTCNHDGCNSAMDVGITSVTLLPIGAIVVQSLAKYI